MNEYFRTFFDNGKDNDKIVCKDNGNRDNDKK